jgi:hypothetical protein
MVILLFDAGIEGQLDQRFLWRHFSAKQSETRAPDRESNG